MKKINPIIAQINAYFNLANCKCSYSNCLLDEAENFGVHSLEQWYTEMLRLQQWMVEHRSEVLLNLSYFRKDWPRCCEVLEELLK